MRNLLKILTPVAIICMCFINSTVSAQVPGNDLICNAIGLSVGLGCTQGTNVNATSTGSPTAATCWNPVTTSNDVWYSFVATTSRMTVSTDFSGLTLNNTQVAVYSSSTNNCLGTLTLLACGENGGTNVANNSITDITVVPGNTYFIRIDGNGANTGTFCVSAYDTYTPGSTPCEAQIVNPNSSGCSNLNGNLATNSTVPNASYPALGVDYGGCDNETAQVGAWTTFVANSASVTLTNSSGGARDYTFFTGTCDNLTWISCTQNIANNATTQFTNLTQGANYYILTTLTGGATTATVNTTHCLTNTVPCTPPTNNDCQNAMAVTANVLYTVTNYCADDDQPPALCSGTLQNNIWFTWTTPNNWTGQAFFQLFQENCRDGNTTEGMQCSIYTAGVVCGSNASCVGTSNTQTDNNVNVVWVPTPGTTYLINYDGYSGEVCNMNFQITNTASVVVLSVNSPTICEGDSAVLTVTSNATGYLWSTGETGSSITVSPSSTTTYSVSATAGGTGSAVSTVTVNPIPSAPVPGNNSPICEGATLNLTASTIANAVYNWMGPNGFTSTQQNPSIPNATAAAAGTYYVRVSVINCESPVDSTVVTINPIPAAPTALSNSPVCTGGTIDLGATSIPNATYSWTGPSGYTSTQQNPSILNASAANAGTYSVTASVQGCTSAPGTVQVSVSGTPAAPQAGSNSPICANSTLNLFAGTVAGATYDWTGPNGFTSNQQNPSIPNADVSASGTYTVIATISGCVSSPGTTTVTVNPIPAAPNVASNSPICEGQTLNLTSDFVAGATYSWTSPNGFSSNQQNPSIPNAQNGQSGNYTLVITVNGCQSDPATTSVVINKIPTPTATSNSPICEGADLELFATTFAFATYSWSGPNGFTSNIQNPTIPAATLAAAGTYSVTVTSNGCVSQQPGSVTVVINPTQAPVASNNGPICSGSTLSLSATTITGATYSWTGPNGFTSNDQNPTIPNADVSNSGTYSVIANVSGCNSSAPATTTAVVNPIPTITAGNNSPICEGSTLNLTASTFAGATYSWTGPNGFTSNVQNPSIPNATIAASGTYSVVASAAGCSSSIPATTDATVNSIPATPVAGSNSPLCEGQTLNLTATLVPGATYSWSGPNGFTSNLQNPSLPNVTLANAGVYTLNSSTNGCNSSSTVANVVVHPIPAAPIPGSNSPVCEGQTIDLTATTVAGATYSWTGPNGFTSNQQNVSIPNAVAANAGTYSITSTVSGCTSAPATTDVVVTPLPPAPIASSNSPVCIGDTLFLFASFIPGATYLWTDLIGFTSTEQNPVVPNVTLLAGSTYTVVATVNGCTGPGSQTTVVVVPRPVASFTSTAPVCLGTPVDFTNTGSTGAGYTFLWDFGPDATPSTSTLENPTGILYATGGTKSVTLTIGGPACSTSVTQTIQITGTPFANFTNDGPACFPPGDVTFTDASTGNITSWQWNFGADATPATANVQGPITVNYTTTGTKLVMLTVSGGGCSNTTTLTVDVGIVGADFTSSVAQNGADGCLGQAVNFYNIGSSGSNASHYWNFGANATPATSTDENPAGIIYSTTGAKIVTHIVTAGSCAMADTVQHIITINPIPTTSFSTTAPVCANVGVDFTNTGSSGSNVTFFWDFGAGALPSTSVAENPSGVNYAFGGTKTVTLAITNEFYCVVQATQNITINSTPTASFTSNAPQCTNMNVDFSNTGTVTGVTWAWDFGFDANPTISNAQNPIGVTYAIPGVKTITLVTTDNSSGCTATASQPITINMTPYASFTTNAPQCSNVGFDFTNTGSTGGSWSYTWNFGANASPTISTAENPTGVMYSSAGTKTITFTVSGQGGCTQTSTQTIVVDPAPVAAFTSNGPQCTGLPVDFTNLGSTTGVTYAWDLGAGATPATSTDQNPTGVVYSTAGTKTVTLIVTNIASGCTATATGTVNINLSPVASFTSNAPQCTTTAIDFTNTGSTGGSWTYLWNFGSGATPPGSTAENPSGITYGSSGNKVITLTVTGGGCTSTTTQTITINSTPVAAFTSNAPVCTGIGVNFANLGTGSGVTWGWDFGGDATPATSASQFPSGVVYSVGGLHAVTLTVTDTLSGCSVSVMNPINIYETPVATFTSTAPQCSATAIDFTNTGSTGSNWSYAWNLGTGANPAFSSAENPSGVLYSSGGTKTVTFTISDQHCNNTSTQQIVINQSPVASFTSTAPQCTGLGIDFTNTGTTSGVDYAWDFGAGATPATSTDQNPVGVVYSTGGTKTISLVTTNSTSGCSVTATNTITIHQSPVATFTSNAPQCATVAINFTNTGSTGSNWAYAWTFGQDANPAVSSAENPSGVMYSSSGTKTVTFSISDQFCTQTATQQVVINATPVVSFASTAPQCTGLGVDFTSGGTNTNVSWAWNFGSGATPATSANQDETGVVYSTAGNKTFTLTVTELTSGCSVTATNTILIHQTPTATFTSNAPQCSTVGINFTNTGSTGSNWSYSWNLGVGANPPVSAAENPTGVMYTSAGVKTVTFTIADQHCTNTSTQTITIQPTPTVGFTSTAPECTGLGIDFTNTGSNSGVTWNWNFGQGATPASSTDENPTGVVYSTAGTKTVTLTTTDAGSGCSVTVNATINIHQTPTASFTSNAPQCANVAIDFTNTGSTGGNWSYAWNFGPGSSPATSTAQNPTGVLYTSGGSKTVTFTISDQNCTQTSTQSITINETPVANFTSTAPQCTGLPVNFTNTGSSANVSWGWTFGNGASPATDIVENPSGVVYSTAGIKTVTLTITNVNTSCSVTATTTINIFQTPTAQFLSSAPQCAGAAVTFTNTGTSGSNWQYDWDFGTDATPAISTSENPGGVLYSSAGSKTVTFTISDANCSNTTTQAININPLPYAEAGADTTICANRTVVLGSDSSVSGVTYNWSPSSTLDNAASANPTASPTAQVTTYTVTVTANGTGCRNSDQVTITMLPPLQANAGPDVEICMNDSKQIGAGHVEGQFYQWTPSTGLSDASVSNPVANPSQTTTYTVVITDTTGCDAITDNVTVTVHDLPSANAGADDSITAGASIQLVGTGGLQYTWTPEAGLSNANIFNPVAAPDSSTDYVLTVTDLFGCKNTDTVRITVINFAKPYWLPSSFTPDGNGHNDVFIVRGGGFVTFEFSIYNRYGELVFISKTIDQGWDGSTKLGDDTPPDAYVWRLTGVLNDGTKVDDKGLVNLVK